MIEESDGYQYSDGHEYFYTDTSSEPGTSSPQSCSPRGVRVIPSPTPKRKHIPIKTIPVSRPDTARPTPRPHSNAARAAPKLPNPTKAKRGGSLPSAQPVSTPKRKNLKRTVHAAPPGTPVHTPPPTKAKVIHVVVNGESKWVTKHTIQKWNWALKDMCLQSGLLPTDIVPKERLHWYQQDYKRFKDKRDLSAAGFLHPEEYFENLEVFNRVCAERNILVHPRTKRPRWS